MSEEQNKYALLQTVAPPKPQRELTTWEERQAQRKAEEDAIRNRVRGARTDKAVFIPALPKPKYDDKGYKRVAVYARVSTKSIEQVSSIENQTRYYSEKIESTPDWDLQEIYSDDGFSGTSIKRRKAFLKMMEDAKDKKMDLILCASVSRFARNMSECMEQIRLLRTMNPSHPIGVYFETENIYTLDPDCGQHLALQALVADWESANKSKRMILSYDQRISIGQYPVSDLLGYRHTKDGDLIIEPEEAKTVRFAFLASMAGYEYSEIADILTEKQRKTLHGRTEWNASMVRSLLMNERRWGDLDVRKRIVVDYIDRKTAPNNKTRASAFIEQHHEGIVSPEIAVAAHMVVRSRNLEGGVPDTMVINSGSLKGFISICPAWAGIDNEAYQEICYSVYTDEEREILERDAKIFTGEEHSKILSMDFAGYQVPRGVLFMNQSSPCLTITRKQIKFNKSCHTKLDGCEYIEILYHPILQVIAIRPSDESNPNAIKWQKEDKQINTVSALAFSNAIYEKMDWISGYSFKFRGITRIRSDSKILLFTLDEPQILSSKKVKKIEAEYAPNQESDIRYIPYKNSSLEEGATIQEHSRKAYPSEWEKSSFGVSLEVRKKRDALFKFMSEQDIITQGTVVENPLIGNIPSRQMVEDELEELLMCM